MSNEARDYDSVVCPECRHQFRQVSDYDAEYMKGLEEETQELLAAVNHLLSVHKGTLAYDGPSMTELRRIAHGLSKV